MKKPPPVSSGDDDDLKGCRSGRIAQAALVRSQTAGLYDCVLLDGDFTAVVATFVADAVIYVPCAAVGADCESRHSSLVVCTAFCGTGLGLSSFRMCHCFLSFFYCFIRMLYPDTQCGQKVIIRRVGRSTWCPFRQSARPRGRHPDRRGHARGAF